MDIGPLRGRLQADLLAAQKARERATVSALRSLLAALSNAEAVPVAPGPYRVVEGRADVPRRELRAAEVAAVVRAEVEERERAISELSARGLDTDDLQAELAVLGRYLAAEAQLPGGGPEG